MTDGMKEEMEAKFPLNVSKDEFREVLRKVGAVCQMQERLMKRVLFGQEANPGIQCDYIRVRDEGDKITMSAKTHARAGGSMSDNRESVTEVCNLEETIAVLKAAGLVVTNHQETKRESWLYGQTYIEIDTWPGLEPYIEIESASEELVKEMADLLGLDWSARMLTSCEELYMEKYNIKTNLEVRELLKYCTFEKHGFENL